MIFPEKAGAAINIEAVPSEVLSHVLRLTEFIRFELRDGD